MRRTLRSRRGDFAFLRVIARKCSATDRGRLDGTWILCRKTVELMCSDHLGDIPGALEPGTPVGLRGHDLLGGGPHDPYYFLDLQARLTGILFMPNGLFGCLDLMRSFLVLSHQAMDDGKPVERVLDLHGITVGYANVEIHPPCDRTHWGLMAVHRMSCRGNSILRWRYAPWAC